MVSDSFKNISACNVSKQKGLASYLSTEFKFEKQVQKLSCQIYLKWALRMNLSCETSFLTKKFTCIHTHYCLLI